MQSNGTDTLVFANSAASGKPMGFTYNGVNYWYMYNKLGDVTDLYSETTHALCVHYEYDAWGNATIIGATANTVGAINPIRYRGYYYDAETGFYFLKSRYYDPTTGRFLNADGQLNLKDGIFAGNSFAYCNNSPILSVDLDGHICGTILGGLFGGIIGGIVGDISSAIQGKSVVAGIVTGAGSGALIGAACGYAADVVATGGVALAVGVTVGASLFCGAVAFGANIANQAWNYSCEKKGSSNRGQCKNSTKNKAKLLRSSNGKIANECKNVWEYVDFNKAATVGISTAVLTPISIGLNCGIADAFADQIAESATTVANFAVNTITNLNTSILQTIIDIS